MRGGLSQYAAAVALGLLVGCGQSAAPDDAPAAPPEVVRMEPAAQALAGAHIRTLDPATMKDAEILKVVGARPHCTFRYTTAGKPVVVVGLGAGGNPEVGVVKLNGKLVLVEPDRAAIGLKPGGFSLVADRVRLRVQPERAVNASGSSQRVEAEMLFEVGEELRVGYGGYFECKAAPPSPTAAHQ